MWMKHKLRPQLHALTLQAFSILKVVVKEAT